MSPVKAMVSMPFSMVSTDWARTGPWAAKTVASAASQALIRMCRFNMGTPGEWAVLEQNVERNIGTRTPCELQVLTLELHVCDSAGNPGASNRCAHCACGPHKEKGPGARAAGPRGAKGVSGGEREHPLREFRPAARGQRQPERALPRVD